MTHFRPRKYFVLTLFALCALLLWPAWSYLRGQDVPQDVPATPSVAASPQTSSTPTTSPAAATGIPKKESAPSADDLMQSIDRKLVETVPDMYEIHGVMWDATPELSPERFAKLAAAGSDNEFEQILSGMLRPRLAPNVVVTAQSQSVTQKAVTDSQGQFKFALLPRGVYELSAEMPSQSSATGVKRTAIAKKRVRLDTNRSAELQLRTDLVTVRGRITDVHGRPVVGAKVTGTEETFHQEEIPNTVLTLSSADGSFELQGFAPPNIYATAGYLNGGRPAAGEHSFYVDICVETDGYVQGKARVPLVTEDLLVPARRLLKIMNKLETQSKGSSRIQEKENVHLPSSHGNTITNVVIGLDQAGTGVK